LCGVRAWGLFAESSDLTRDVDLDFLGRFCPGQSLTEGEVRPGNLWRKIGLHLSVGQEIWHGSYGEFGGKKRRDVRWRQVPEVSAKKITPF
jgi:hypothetical protein